MKPNSPHVRLSRFVLFLAPPVAVVVAQLFPGTARPLPLFTHAQRATCGDCHSPPPRLNAAGLTFLQRGYRASEVGATPVWKTHSIPLAVIGNIGVASPPRDVGSLSADREFMNDRRGVGGALEIHSAGTLADDVSYHFKWDRIGERPSFATPSAFIQLDDIIARAHVNLRAGASESEIPFLSNARRTTLHPYLSPVTLAARGFELNGAAGDWGYAAGLTSDQAHHLEDSYFSFLGNAKGSLFAARMLFDRQSSNLPYHTWLQHLQTIAGGEVTSGRTALVAGYVFDRFDDRPAAGIHDRHQYYLLDILRPLDRSERWWLTARYEHEYRTPTVLTPEEDHQLGVLNLTRQVNANAKLAVEVAHAGDNVAGPRVDTLDAYVDLAF